jgi:sugar phosphate isomerase/epimerase
VSLEVGLSTGIAYRRPIEDVLEPIAAAGIGAIEVSTAPGHLPSDSRGLGDLARRIGSLGLRVHSLHAPFGHDVNLTSPDPGQRRSALERLREAADTLATLGGRLYVIHPGGEDQRWVWEREDRLRASVEGLTGVWRICRERHLELVVETPLPHLLGGRPEDFAWILERIPAEHTGVCIDTSHCALGGFLLEAVRSLGARVVHVQASDNRGQTDDHLPPGRGRIDWEEFARALAAIQYRGVFMLEVAGEGGLVTPRDAASLLAGQSWASFAGRRAGPASTSP